MSKLFMHLKRKKERKWTAAIEMLFLCNLCILTYTHSHSCTQARSNEWEKLSIITLIMDNLCWFYQRHRAMRKNRKKKCRRVKTANESNLCLFTFNSNCCADAEMLHSCFRFSNWMMMIINDNFIFYLLLICNDKYFEWSLIIFSACKFLKFNTRENIHMQIVTLVAQTHTQEYLHGRCRIWQKYLKIFARAQMT
jgi:hypothetical protein